MEVLSKLTVCEVKQLGTSEARDVWREETRGQSKAEMIERLMD